jgi:O-antigen/teichoic acid export membrane protein
MAHRVAWNSLWLMGQPLLLNVLSLVSTGYIARKLGAADYGAFNLGYAQIVLFQPLCHLGLRQVGVRALAENREKAPEIMRSLFALRLLFTGIAALLALGWLALPTYSVTTRLIGAAAVVTMIGSSLNAVILDLFQSFEKPGVAARSQLVGGVLLTLLSVLALMAGGGLAGFVAAYVLGTVIQLALLVGTARKHLFFPRPRWDRQRIGALLRETRPFALLSVLSPVTYADALDVMILGLVTSPLVVGPYTAALGLVNRLGAVPEGIVAAMYPAVANGYREQRDEVERTVWRYLFNLLLVTLPLALCLCFSAPTVLRVLFGKPYLTAVDALRIGAWFLPLWGINHLMRQCLSAVRHQDRVVRLTLVSGILLGSLYAVFIPTLGITGAALGTVLREVLMLGLWLRPFNAHFGRPPVTGDLGRLALALGIMAAPFALLLVCQNSFATITAALLSWACYLGAIRSLGLADPAAVLKPVRARLGRGSI